VVIGVGQLVPTFIITSLGGSRWLVLLAMLATLAMVGASVVVVARWLRLNTVRARLWVGDQVVQGCADKAEQGYDEDQLRPRDQP
jgi:hypothetical protein